MEKSGKRHTTTTQDYGKSKKARFEEDEVNISCGSRGIRLIYRGESGGSISMFNSDSVNVDLNVSCNDVPVKEEVISDPENDDVWENDETLDLDLKFEADSSDPLSISDFDLNYETSVNVAEPSNTSTSRPKETEMEAIISHKKVAGGLKVYCLKWKDAAKGKTWVNAQIARTCYPNLFRDYNGKAYQIEAVLASKFFSGGMKYLIKWKDAAKGDSWVTRKQMLAFSPGLLHKLEVEEKKMNEAEAILSRMKVNGVVKYLVQWKDQLKDNSWESERRIKKFNNELLTTYKRNGRKAKSKLDESKVEAIVSHTKSRYAIKYLVKWRDHSKGETWVTSQKLLEICPQAVSDYEETLQMKPNEVEAIVGHRKKFGCILYLVKWKDHSKGETWKTADSLKLIGPDILDEYVEKNRDDLNKMLADEVNANVSVLQNCDIKTEAFDNCCNRT